MSSGRGRFRPCARVLSSRSYTPGQPQPKLQKLMGIGITPGFRIDAQDWFGARTAQHQPRIVLGHKLDSVVALDFGEGRLEQFRRGMVFAIIHERAALLQRKGSVQAGIVMRAKLLFEPGNHLADTHPLCGQQFQEHQAGQQPISLQSLVGESEDTNFGDFIEDKAAENPSEMTSYSLLKDKLTDVLCSLSERERKVLELRFGLGDGAPRTLEEVGKQFRVTRERIRQIEAKALRKMRHPTRLRHLHGFIEVEEIE